MAQFQVSLNIQSSLFPLLSELEGDDVIISKGDQTYVPDINPSASVAPVSKGVAQIMYAHNVMPSTYGYQSVGYVTRIVAMASPAQTFDIVLPIVSTTKFRTYVGTGYTGTDKLAVLDDNGVWVIPTDSPTVDSDTQVTVATVNGKSYICVATKGVWNYDSDTGAFVKVTLTGLQDSGIMGVLQSSGYLLTWSDTGVAWSAVDDPEDFTPSTTTGAGAGEIQDAKGRITYCQPTSYGFIVYTESNAISTTYSGNSSYPFNFKAIPGAGGIPSGELVSVETVGAQYAYTTNGLQQIYHTGAKTVLGYVTDFLSGDVFEDYDEDTGVFSITHVTAPLAKKITLCNDRYLVMSYGTDLNGPFTHAVVVDLTQTRMGKLKCTHTAVLDYRDMTADVYETPRKSIGLLQSDGTILTVDFDLRQTSDIGVALLGRYRVSRAGLTTIHRVRFENILENASFTCEDYANIDTKDLTDPQSFTQDTNIPASAGLRDYYGELKGQTHTLLVKGTFNLVSVVINFTGAGVY